MSETTGAGDHHDRRQQHRAAERVDEVARAWSGAVASAAGLNPLPSCAWKIAPVRDPEAPIMRNIESTPEAIPAFWTGTAFIAALVIGDIVIAMPMPSSMKPGSRSR